MQPDSTSNATGRSRGRVVVSVVLGVALVLGSVAVAMTGADYLQSRLKSGTVVDVKTGKDLAKKNLKVRAVLKQGPLIPGVKRPLKVTMKNPYNEPVKVKQVTVKVKKPDAAGCKKVWFKASAFTSSKKNKPILIKPHKKASVKLTVKLKNLPHVNQDACKNTHVPLKVKATAKQA